MFGLFPAENLDTMIAMQTKNKLGKALGPPDFTGPNGNMSNANKIITFYSTHASVIGMFGFAGLYKLITRRSSFFNLIFKLYI